MGSDPHVGRTLVRFHHRVDLQMIGKQPQKFLYGGRDPLPPVEVIMYYRLKVVDTYITWIHNKFAQYILIVYWIVMKNKSSELTRLC